MASHSDVPLRLVSDLVGDESRDIRLLRGTFPRWPAYDIAVRRTLLQRVANGEEPETFRVYSPPPTVAFGRQDVARPGFADAVDAVRRGGFEATKRFVGARTMAMHEGVLAFEHYFPDAQAQVNYSQRNVETAGAMAQALRDLGVEARIGDVFGEYSPGAYSVNARGRVKLASLEQRLVPGASYLNGHIVVSGAEALREMLVVVNEAVDFDWDPETLVGVEDEVSDVTVNAVSDALLAEMRTRHITFALGTLPDQIFQVARAFEPEHVL